MQAQALGINGTPTFLINGRKAVGGLPLEELRALVEGALKARR